MEKILLILAGFSIPYIGFSQSTNRDTTQPINLNARMTNLREIRNKISHQTGFYLYIPNLHINMSKKFPVPAKKLALNKLLDIIKTNLHVTVAYNNEYISITAGEKRKFRKPAYQGTIIDEYGAGLKGVEIWDIQTLATTTSNRKGRFNLEYPIKDRHLRFFLEGYVTREILVRSELPILIELRKMRNDSLEVAHVTARKPGAESRRTETSYSVDPTELCQGYNNNMLSTLQGKVPGMLYIDANGASGGTGRLQIRGQHSIGLIPGSGNLPTNTPLILINGVVWSNGNISMSKLSSMAGDPEASGFQSGLSPINNINSEDIESIQVYVGADATALFGTRGTHGVISIQTKNGKTGDGKKFSVNIFHGIAVAAFRIRLMNTIQYAGMRREAILNDSKIVDESSAPELFKWPLTRSTDWYKYLLGGTATINQCYISTTGEIRKHFNFYLGGGLRQETSVLPGHFPNRRATLHCNLNHSRKENSILQLTMLLTHSHHRMPAVNPMPYINLVPNAPQPIDSKGNLVFEENGLQTTNINAQLHNPHIASLSSLFCNLDYKHSLDNKFSLNGKLGLNYNSLKEQNTFPIAAQPSGSGITATMKTASTSIKAITLDIYTQYQDSSKAHKRTIGVTLGGNAQMQSDSWKKIEYSGYAADQVIGMPDKAMRIDHRSWQDQYRYIGMYAAANFSYRNKYLLHLIARYDGSSRFSSANQFGLFGGIGAGWIFSNSSWCRNIINGSWIGKLRASISTSGNDQVANNSHEDVYLREANNNTYSGILPLRIIQVANPNLDWEKILKKEIALDLKLKSNLSFSIVLHHSLTTNNFIAEMPPSQYGLPTMQIVNHDAAVINKGIELIFSVTYRLGKKIHLVSHLTATLPQNRLHSFHNLDHSLYRSALILGESLTAQRGLSFVMVDPQNGYNDFRNIAGSPEISIPEDLKLIGHLDPKAFGGLYNRIKVRNWEIGCFLDFKIQTLLSPRLGGYQRNPGSFRPEMLTNQEVSFMDRWRRPGDHSSNQRLSAYGNPAFNKSTEYYISSDAMLENGSYLRIKDVEISYSFTEDKLKKTGLKILRIYARGENLFILTSFRGGDPTILYPTAVPSLRAFMFGIDISRGKK